MKWMLRALGAIVLAMPALAYAQVTPLPVDENVYLKGAFDFSPVGEPLRSDDPLLASPAEAYPFPQAAIKLHGGRHTIFINDEPMPNWMRSSSATTIVGAPVERRLRESGVRVFLLDVGWQRDRHGKFNTVEDLAKSNFDTFRERADKILAVAPDAQLIIRLWLMNVGDDYVRDHPDALLQGEDGQTDWGRAYYSTHHHRPNATEAWRHYCGKLVRDLIDRVGQSEYAPHLAGMYIGALNSGEWWYYKGAGDPGWDYSDSRQRVFDAYVKHKYGDDPAAIARAWGVPVTDDLLKLPSLKERQAWDRQPVSKVADYHHVMNLPMTAGARYFARIIKAASRGRMLAGMEIHVGLMTYPINGTTVFTHLVQCPDIDMFGGPPSYGGRGMGEATVYRAVLGSLHRHGKIWFNEGDYRTHAALMTLSGAQGEPPIDPEANRQIFHRELARGVVFDYPTYMMDFGWSWFLDESVSQAVRENLAVDRFVNEVGLKRRAHVAVVSDQESQFYANYFANPTQMLRSRLDRIGASWDYYELDDFLALDDKAPYRLVIFLNIRALSEQERQGINQLKADQRTILWLHDPGVVDLSYRGRPVDAQLRRLTGIGLKSGVRPKGQIKLVQENMTRAFGQRVTASAPVGDPLDGAPQTVLNQSVSLSDTNEGLPIGNLPASIVSDDPDALPLGVDEAGQAYFVMKRLPTWTSVYAAVCSIEPSLVRQIAMKAGVPVHLDSDDVIFAAENFLAIHASSDGDKTLMLTTPTDVYDLFNRQVVARQASTITVSLKRGQTRFFHLGDADAADALMKRIDADMAREKQAFVKAHPSPQVSVSFHRHHSPRPSDKQGLVNLAAGPEVILTAGPFPSDAVQTAQLDAALARLAAKNGQGIAPVSTADAQALLPAVSRDSDTYLNVLEPRTHQAVTDGLAPWLALQPRIGSWVNDYALGMARGQSYAGAFFLAADESTPVQLAYAFQGEGRLWVDGKAITLGDGHGYQSLTLDDKPRLVLFRVRGGEGFTGFSFKVISADSPRNGVTFKAVKGVKLWLPSTVE